MKYKADTAWPIHRLTIGIMAFAVSRMRKVRGAACAIVLVTVGGCATFSQDGGFDSVAATAQKSIGRQVQWARNAAERERLQHQVAELLKLPLSADDAVQVALLNNRDLQATFQELGISEADLVQSSRLPNPKFTLRDSHQANQYDVEQTLTFNILSLLTIPLAHAVERRRFEQTQYAMVIAVVQLAQQTRTAYFNAVAAAESARYWQQVKAAADAGAELAGRMVAAGNWSRLDQVREQGFYNDAIQGLARARFIESSTREDLTQSMGLWGEQTDFQLAQRLPDLPMTVDDLPNVEQSAMQGRLDLKMMSSQTIELAQQLRLTATTRFINVLDLGATRVLEGPRSYPYEKGVEVSLEIPLFDTGAARVKRSEAVYAQAVDHLAQAAVVARSQVRKAYLRYRTTYDIAKQQRDAVLPLRALVVEQGQLRYNGMLVSVFDLLADARAQIAGVNDYMEYARNFWIAKAALDMAMLANPAASTGALDPSTAEMSAP